jgi:hypothetical protein
MKHLTAALALAAAALAPTLAHAGLDGTNPVHPMLGVAITGGGDKLSSAEFSNGYSKDINAGSLIDLYGGIEFHQQGSPFGAQATVGYHFDNTSARNGDQRFTRVPFEAIALYSVTPKIRLGIGARYASDAKFRSSGAGDVGDANFKSQLGGLLMAEWLITPSMGLQLRYVNEKYKIDGSCANGGVTPCQSSYTIDGSHGGLGFNYYF